jgi:formylglycine-generating enzyme required for sulfatase activity
MSHSPFKFLDSYTKDDKEIFFGREREVEELYHRVFEGKIMLVYGVSGTGKSSLIHCGLANKFQDADWLPANIRRAGDMVRSMAFAINQAAITPMEGEIKTPAQFKKAVRSLYLDHYKPIFFIFDQFEELFIFGNREEKKEFIQIVKALTESDLQCRFMFVLREEYLAGITEFEKVIPTILANRVRIERMTLANAKQVIEGPCKVFGIGVEEGFSDEMLEKLSPGSAEVELTYLQVYLDKVYRSASASSPVIASEERAKQPERSGARRSQSVQDKEIASQRTLAMTFTKEILKNIGEVKDLLGSFLDEQIELLPDPDSALAVLKSFVSVKGTKRQMSPEEVQDYAQTLGKPISESALQELLQTLIQLRILRDKDQNNRYELRHDALATKIYEKITLVEKELLEIRQFIENAYENFQKRSILLNANDLKYIAPYEDKIFFNKSLENFIEKSKQEFQKARRKKRNMIIISGIVLLAIFAAFTIWALAEKNKSDKMLSNNIQLLYAFVPDTTKQFYRYFENIASQYLDEADYVQSFRYYRFARLSPDVPPDLAQVIEENETKSESLMNLNKFAVEHFRNLEHKEAENIYTQMLQLMPGDSILMQRIWHCQNPAFKKENLVFIKGGTFIMGSGADYADDDETPHTVTLTDFYMGKYEVTNAEFAEFLNIYGSDKVLEGDYINEIMIEYGDWGIIKKGKIWLPDKDTVMDYAHYSVMRVSWYGASEFCRFYKVMLPSEAQWEYAARSGGKNHKYSWGNEEPGQRKVANIADESAKKVYTNWTVTTGYDDGYAHTSPVGVFPPNELGIYDMGGNVWEWCLDWYAGDFYSGSDGQTNPVNLKKIQNRVLRGGSWCYGVSRCRSASRIYITPGDRDSNIGFRVVYVP